MQKSPAVNVERAEALWNAITIRRVILGQQGVEESEEASLEHVPHIANLHFPKLRRFRLPQRQAISEADELAGIGLMRFSRHLVYSLEGSASRATENGGKCAPIRQCPQDVIYQTANMRVPRLCQCAHRGCDLASFHHTLDILHVVILYAHQAPINVF